MPRPLDSATVRHWLARRRERHGDRSLPDAHRAASGLQARTPSDLRVSPKRGDTCRSSSVRTCRSLPARSPPTWGFPSGSTWPLRDGGGSFSSVPTRSPHTLRPEAGPGMREPAEPSVGEVYRLPRAAPARGDKSHEATTASSWMVEPWSAGPAEAGGLPEDKGSRRPRRCPCESRLGSLYGTSGRFGSVPCVA